jgi:hypothetical protein
MDLGSRCKASVVSRPNYPGSARNRPRLQVEPDRLPQQTRAAIYVDGGQTCPIPQHRTSLLSNRVVPFAKKAQRRERLQQDRAKHGGNRKDDGPVGE